MKKRIILFTIILIINLVLCYSFTFANKIILKYDLLINLNSKEIVDTPKEENEEEIKLNENDKTIIKKINLVFKNTYLENSGEFITKESNRRNVNPYLIAAIILENSKCDYECSLITTRCNNISDFKNGESCLGGKYTKYNTLNDSISDLIEYIQENFYSKNIKNPLNMYSKLKKDVVWAYNVNNKISLIRQDEIE